MKETKQGEWEIYTNSRFGYTINYPKDWKEGNEADNRDGKALHKDKDNEILVYGTLQSSTFSTRDTPIEREVFVLNDGKEATELKYKDKDSKITYIVFFEEDGTQYTFDARLSEDFYSVNEQLLQEVAKSFKRIKINPKLPECFAGRCPIYMSIDVDGDNSSSESVVIIPDEIMTKGVGQVWVIKEGKIIFESQVLPGIGVKGNGQGNGFILYWKDWTNPASVVEATAEYTYENGTFKEKNDEQACDNYTEIKQFEKSVPVVWTAKFDGCLVSCWGGAFTGVPANSEHPMFAGYVPDEGDRINEKYLKEGLLLKITGEWTGIDSDHVFMFNRRCVPTVEIEKIEIIKQ